MSDTVIVASRSLRTRPLLLAFALWLMASLLVGSLADAGKFNPVLSVGAEAPAWKELEGVDGKRHSLADLADKSVLVVVFTCNTCPYAVDVEDRLIGLSKTFAGDSFSLVAINANQISADDLESMKSRAEEKGFNFAYLRDATQQVAKSYGANYTPEFFVLNKERKIVYMGALDDSPNGKNVSQRHVEDAVRAALAGRAPQVTETVPIGCRVRYARQRRTK
ncbi:MAG: thioredoxin family protein [Planctomycetales bacterium]|nr:thioredoxin family protein [Planctomycetales bacterium]